MGGSSNTEREGPYDESSWPRVSLSRDSSMFATSESRVTLRGESDRSCESVESRSFVGQLSGSDDGESCSIGMGLVMSIGGASTGVRLSRNVSMSALLLPEGPPPAGMIGAAGARPSLWDEIGVWGIPMRSLERDGRRGGDVSMLRSGLRLPLRRAESVGSIG